MKYRRPEKNTKKKGFLDRVKETASGAGRFIRDTARAVAAPAVNRTRQLAKGDFAGLKESFKEQNREMGIDFGGPRWKNLTDEQKRDRVGKVAATVTGSINFPARIGKFAPKKPVKVNRYWEAAPAAKPLKVNDYRNPQVKINHYDPPARPKVNNYQAPKVNNYQEAKVDPKKPFAKFTKGPNGKFTGSRRIEENPEAGFVRNPAEPVYDVAVATKKQFRPAINAVRAEGKAGSELAGRIERATDVGEVSAGKRLAEWRTAPRKMTQKEKFNFVDVAEGRATPMNETVEKASKAWASLRKGVADEAIESGVKTRRRGILTDSSKARTAYEREQIAKKGFVRTNITEKFKPRENYYTHRIPDVETLRKGPVRDDVADFLVHRQIRPDRKSAEGFIDEYIEFVDSGKQKDSLLEFMVESGQSKTTSEAFASLQRYRNRTIKRGATEYGRDVDLPFFDPDPSRAIPQYLNRESRRLPQIREFGEKNEIVNDLINRVRQNGGDADFTRTAVDRILGIANESKSALVKAGVILRTIQGFKLGLASISNMTQGLNAWLKGDSRALLAGIWGAITPEGRRFALKSGATLESTLEEAAKTTGALKTFLKATGFTATEKFNRTLAASAGRSYGTRLFEKAAKGNRRAIEEMAEFGVDMKGKTALTDDDVLMIAKKFTDITQFRTRPQDLPLFASSEPGKLVFQFKNFIYGQTRLVARTTLGEFRRGNFGRGTRNLLLLASVYPLAGEAVADLRAAITGKERESKGLRRYFENLGQVGGLGILYDAVKSGSIGKGAEYLAGPTVGDAAELIEAGGQLLTDPPKTERGMTPTQKAGRALGRFFTKRVPVFGSRVTEAAYPKDKPAKKRRRRIKRR